MLFAGNRVHFTNANSGILKSWAKDIWRKCYKRCAILKEILVKEKTSVLKVNLCGINRLR